MVVCRSSLFQCVLAFLTAQWVIANTPLAAFPAAAALSNLDSSNHYLLRLLRRLQTGDFDELNKMLADLRLNLPDSDVSQSGLDLNIQNLYCTEVSISDMAVNFTENDPSTLTSSLKVNVSNFHCYADYRYSFTFFHGKGSMEVQAQDNQISTDIAFLSPSGFEQAPPLNATILSCNTQINIYDINFEGGLLGGVLDLLKSLITGVIENAIQKTLCEKLDKLGDSLDKLLTNVTKKLDPLLQPLPDHLNDPLGPEKNLSVSKDLHLLDFQNSNKTIIDLLDRALKEVDKLGELVNDSAKPGSQDLGINVLLRKSLLEEDGSLSLNITDLGDTLGSKKSAGMLYHGQNMIANTSIAIDGLKIFGLDTLRKFDPLNINGSFTFENEMVWEYLQVIINLTVNLEPSTKEDALLQSTDPMLITEQVQVTVGIHNLSAALSFLMAVDEDKLWALELGSLFSSKKIIKCFLSTMYAFEVSGLYVHIDDLDAPVIQGLLAPGGDRVMSSVVKAALIMYEPTLLRAIPNLFQNRIRKFLNKKVDEIMNDNDNCTSTEWSEEYIDFRDLLLKPEIARSLGGSGSTPYGDIPYRVYDLVLGESTKDSSKSTVAGATSLNDRIIRPLTKENSGTAGRLEYKGDIINGSRRVIAGNIDAVVDLRISDIFVENLDSLAEPISLLQPVPNEPQLLNNTARFGVGKPLRMGGRFKVGLVGGDTTIRNDFEISASIDEATVVLSALVNIVESAALGLPIEALREWKCWLAVLPSPKLDVHGMPVPGSEAPMSLSQVKLSLAQLAMNLTCVDCTGPQMQELTELLSQPEVIQDTTRFSRDLISFATKLLEGDLVQTFIDRNVVDAKLECPYSPDFTKNRTRPVYEPVEEDPDTNSGGFLLAVVITALVLLVAVAIIFLGTRMFVRRRHREWLTTLSKEKVSVLATQQNLEESKAAAINGSSRSLFESDGISTFVRYFIPVVILGNIALFLSGHLSLGASVAVVISLAGQSYVADDFFEFSIASTTVKIWNAGAKELSMLMFMFSLIWPYIKLLLTMYLWFAPTRKVTVGRRENILLWMDILAKWSIIDVFVLVMTLAAFRVSIHSPDVGFLPPGFYSVDLIVVLEWGLYANMIAQLVSQITSHFVIYYHRKVVQLATESVEGQKQVLPSTKTAVWEPGMDDSDSLTNDKDFSTAIDQAEIENLCDHAFSRPHRGETEKLVSKSFVSPLLVVTAVSIFGLFIAGCMVPSYSINILGIVGILVESGQRFTDAKTMYDVFSTVSLLMDQAAFMGKVRDYIGLGTLSVLVVLTVLIVPLMQCVVLLYMWFKPMSRLQRYRVMVTNEILAAWQYAEVYLLAIIVASWQLGSLSQYMINVYCEGLSNTFAELASLGLIKSEDAQCMQINTSVEKGFFVLAAGALLLALLNTFVMRAVRQYNRDKDNDDFVHAAKAIHPVDDEDSLYGIDTDKIHPAPVLFTDTFRWLLRRDDSDSLGRIQALTTQPSAMSSDLYRSRSEGGADLVDDEPWARSKGNMAADDQDESWAIAKRDDGDESWAMSQKPNLYEGDVESAQKVSTDADDVHLGAIISHNTSDNDSMPRVRDSISDDRRRDNFVDVASERDGDGTASLNTWIEKQS